MQTSKSKTTYRDSGVNIDKANQFVMNIKSLAESTHHQNVLGSLGGFAGLYEIPQGYDQPVLVSSTDGVGTKLCLAINANRHHGIGIDLVAMCVNDLICCGATPLYFLDYYATGQLNPTQGVALLEGIRNGCEQSAMALIGGETAEMPGVYANDHYDLAGFSVGIIEKSAIISGQNIRPGMQVIGLASSGCHANGYSLIRKLLADHQIDLQEILAGKPLIDALLEPTKIYVTSIQNILTDFSIFGMAHITGGGFYENLPRILPENCAIKIDRKGWEIPPLFNWLQELSGLNQTEMFTTFNMGIGYALIVEQNDLSSVLQRLNQTELAFHIGEVTTKDTANVEIN